MYNPVVDSLTQRWEKSTGPLQSLSNLESPFDYGASDS